MDTLNSGSQPAKLTSSFGRLLAIVGSWCLFAPLVGLSIGVILMIRYFNERSGSGAASDSAIPSNWFGMAFVATEIGLVISIIGLCLILGAVFRYRFTPPWLRSVLIGGSLMWLLAFPVGTVVAIVALIVLLRKNHVFTTPKVD